jgi:hypothetical protein
VFHMDIAKVDQDVAYVSHICYKSCSKCFICFSLMLQQVFSCCKLQVFYLAVAYVLYIYCKCVFQMFNLFQTYIAFKSFMLQVFYVV